MVRGNKRFVRLILTATLVLGLLPLPAYGQTVAQGGEAPAGETAAPASVDFVYLDEEAPVAGQSQLVVVAFGEQSANFHSAVLDVACPDGSQLAVASDSQAEGAALFTLDDLQEGGYRLLGVTTLASDGSELEETSLASDESGSCSFTVGAPSAGALSLEAATAQDAVTYVLDDAGDVATVSSTLDYGTDDISRAVEEAVWAASSADPARSSGIAAFSAGDAASSRAATDSRDIIIAIDPGHGGGDPGAVSSGLREADLTWEIAQACVARLNELGIKTYVTRAKNECPSLTDRVLRSVKAGASAFVSIHLNSATSSAAQGAEVWYPNDSSYRYDLHEQGLELSKAILKKLTALGLYDRGAKVKDATAVGDDPAETYPDGSISDYYTVINEARRNNIVGIIVEHCFITNNAEALKLRDPAFVKSLGVADAEGIAQSISNGVISPALPKPGENDGSNPVNQWEQRGSSWYRFGPDGKLVVGWADIDGVRYHFDEAGVMATDWQLIDGSWYYFKGSGAMATGWMWVKGKCYYLDPSTGKMATGSCEVGGVRYALDAAGAWIDASDGWAYSSGGWYWLDDGELAKGWKKVGGTWYYLDAETGLMAEGWKKVGSAWYYLNPGGDMAEGWKKVNGAWYYLNPGSGAMAEGWKKVNGTWYYLNPGSGSMAEGWKKLGSAWYYLNPGGGDMAEGWKKVNGAWYYLNPGSGAMAEGWKKVNGTWYYLNPGSGSMAEGWKKLGSAWYYLNPGSGSMAEGWLRVSDKWYLMGYSGDGAMKTGWQKVGDTWYLMGGPDDGAMKTGWQKMNGKWYYLGESHDGAMATGWRKIGGTWYLFGGSGDGAMRTGWQYVGGLWYYLSASGAMVTGSQTINGVVRNFGENGACLNPPAEPALEPLPGETQDPVPSEKLLTIMGAPESTVAQMTQAYMRTNAVYPAAALGKGGAPTIKDFCQIIYDEAVAEGVRPEVVYCQVMHETGNLKFGGDVKIGQFNFAGIGATGGGASGNSFKDVRTGIRAQVQHLKCYASSEPLNQACVDPRWWDALRSTAVYVQHLGIQENPNTVRNEDGTIKTGRGWATAKNYGYTLANSIKLYFGVE